MALPRLIDIAKSNIIAYQNKYDVMSDDDKDKIQSVKQSITPSINMETDALLSTLKDRYKNRFELCSEANDITVNEFKKLSIEQQTELIIEKINPKYRQFGIRRVDFSNRYEDGLRLYYLAPYMGFSAGNSKYGKYCICAKPLFLDTDVVLKHDSLRHYFNKKNEYNEDACHRDLLPYNKAELLILDKYSEQIISSSVETIRRFVEMDSDPFEIMTTTLLNADKIETVVISFEDYKYISELNKKKLRIGYSEPLESKEEEDLRNYLRLQRELRLHGINIRIAKKMSEAI